MSGESEIPKTFSELVAAAWKKKRKFPGNLRQYFRGPTVIYIWSSSYYKWCEIQTSEYPWHSWHFPTTRQHFSYTHTTLHCISKFSSHQKSRAKNWKKKALKSALWYHPNESQTTQYAICLNLYLERVFLWLMGFCHTFFITNKDGIVDCFLCSFTMSRVTKGLLRSQSEWYKTPLLSKRSCRYVINLRSLWCVLFKKM